MVNEPPSGADDDMEHFDDADKSANGGAGGNPADADAPGEGSTSGYDPRRREPAAANADKSAFWELVRTSANRCIYRRSALTATVEDRLRGRAAADAVAALPSIRRQVCVDAADWCANRVHEQPPGGLCPQRVPGPLRVRGPVMRTISVHSRKT